MITINVFYFLEKQMEFYAMCNMESKYYLNTGEIINNLSLKSKEKDLNIFLHVLKSKRGSSQNSTNESRRLFKILII